MKRTVLSYWLGTPCRYDLNRPDLEDLGLPEVDLGGRCISIPIDVSPAEFFDKTMPNVFQIQAEARKRQMMGKGFPPDGALAEGLQCLWIFTASAQSTQQEQLKTAFIEIDALKKRIVELEKKAAN